nr:16S rRNA pseudouridine(516) synthase [Treponema sp.]
MTERLDKILSHAGFGTRKDAKKILRKGLVTVNGEVVRDFDFKLDLEKDQVAVDGEILSGE